MSYGWEGNRRFGVALAIRHRRQWLIQLRAKKGEEHAPNTAHWVWNIFIIAYLYNVCVQTRESSTG